MTTTPSLPPFLRGKLANPILRITPAKQGDGLSILERRFLRLWQSLEGPLLATQHKFHPVRKWRLDFAHLASQVAIETHGATWRGRNGRHTSGKGFAADREKMNAAILAGWRVFELTSQMINAATLAPIIALVISSEKSSERAAA